MYSEFYIIFGILFFASTVVYAVYAKSLSDKIASESYVMEKDSD